MGKNTSPLRLSLLMAGLLMAGAVNAQQATYTLDIPAQALDRSLNALASQTGSRILFATDVAQSRQAVAIHADMSVDQALQRLVAGTGLNVQKSADGSYFVTTPVDASGALALGATNINSQLSGDVTEGTRSYTTGSTSSATKLPLTLRETPQSVTVVTRQQMDDHGAHSVGDVLRNTPGISQQAYDSDRMEFSTRGFAITNYQYDGVNRIYDGVYGEAATHVDTATFDRIEVIKGSTGLMTGSGDPSATVNLVRKKPTKEFKAVSWVRIRIAIPTWITTPRKKTCFMEFWKLT
jgi:outer membrane receptor for ferric coprogen and ferric-rhodotorulic acid